MTPAPPPPPPASGPGTPSASGRGSTPAPPWRRAVGPRWLWVAFGVLVVVAFARVLSGADQLTSSGTVSAALGATVPIAMAALGGMWAERAGVVNIGLEGMMILGTFGAGCIGWEHGPWAGLVAAVLFGAIGGLVHAIATVTFGVDHIVSGVAINILGLGVTKYLAAELLEGTPGGGQSQSPPIGSVARVSVPGIESALRPVENRHWFLVSDLAGLLRGLLTDVSLFTLIAVALVVLSAVILWRTPFGLRLRSCGEEPHAAETLGVNVYAYKYAAVVVSGALAGFGGAYLAEVAANIYREGQTGGRGYIGLASMIFGNWRPGGLAAGAGLFGYTDALQLRNAPAVHALLLVAAVLLAAGGLVMLLRWFGILGAGGGPGSVGGGNGDAGGKGGAVAGKAGGRGGRRRIVVAIACFVAAGGLAAWYAGTDSLPGQVVTATPYVTTLLVLAFASQRLRPPKADGLVYRRGEE
ncbi:ABC transporter permease [Frankia sp. CNm7]|nr:ABC transporter permease [Frankia nepalensis]MBL7516425.1 ABC transporter permease [Frankia nepalensis]MBL7517945.1 ABC transporter permease [Frankia nepalensis]